MGNSNSTEGKDIEIDHGKTGPLLKLYSEGGYSKDQIRKLITERKLAPFYHGQETEEDYKKNIQLMFAQSSDSKGTNRSLPRSLQKDDIKNFESPLECPICFLFYPRNYNYTRCCSQPICTDCFIQIKRNLQFEPATCPYCTTSNFGILYIPFQSSKFKENSERRQSIGHTHPSIVSTDDIYPDWQFKKLIAEKERKREEERLALNNARRIQYEYLASSIASHQFLINQRREQRVIDVDELMLLEAVRRSMVEAADDFTEEERAFISQTENVASGGADENNSYELAGSDASQVESGGSQDENAQDKTSVAINAETHDELPCNISFK